VSWPCIAPQPPTTIEKLPMKQRVRIALITGGGKGIGRAFSLRLAEEGWGLVLCGRDRVALTATARTCMERFGSVVQTVATDLSDNSGVAAVVGILERALPDALICNAANYGALGYLANVDPAAWQASFNLNFFSVATLLHHYVRLAKATPCSHRRKLVVMGGSGLGGSRVWPGASAYSCAKAALYRLVEIIHEEAHGDGIDINCVAPGAVKTSFTEQARHAGKDVLGPLFDEAVKVDAGGGEAPELAAATVAKLVSPLCDGLSGRLISAKWDNHFLDKPQTVRDNADLLRLRRIDDHLFKRSAVSS
jgi:NAD(P)-dependent dehydrogenase (short-subunit alcohol dehydrogenase family)